jgi:hypothetical protein
MEDNKQIVMKLNTEVNINDISIQEYVQQILGRLSDKSTYLGECESPILQLRTIGIEDIPKLKLLKKDKYYQIESPYKINNTVVNTFGTIFKVINEYNDNNEFMEIQFVGEIDKSLIEFTIINHQPIIWN